MSNAMDLVNNSTNCTTSFTRNDITTTTALSGPEPATANNKAIKVLLIRIKYMFTLLLMFSYSLVDIINLLSRMLKTEILILNYTSDFIRI